MTNTLNFNDIGAKGDIYYEDGVSYHFLNKSGNNYSISFHTKGIDMIEVKITEINEDNNSTGFVFHLSLYLNYEDSETDDGERENDEPSKRNTTLIIIIVVSIAAVVIIVVLIVILMNYNKNQNVGQDINKISF